MRAKCAELGFVLEAVGVSGDHVHVFIGAGPKWSPADVIRRLKGYTSRELRKEFPALKRMGAALWSPSYFCRAVGGGNEEVVRKYVEGQS